MARSGDLGWAGSGIWARREGLGKARKGESRKEMGGMEDEGNSSCKKLRVVSAVLLVVAVCQNTPSEIQFHAKVPKTRFSDLWNIFPPVAR